MITPDLIQRRIDNFWGYGNLEAPVWFVGMEEGLNPTTDVEELEMRFRVADGKPTVDMRYDMSALASHMKWFLPDAPVQSTWKYPIALYLYLKNGTIPEKEEIRKHQAFVMGDVTLRETCNIELMPLPSRNSNESTWLYAGYGITGLDSRKQYIAMYKMQRVEWLRELFHQYKPKLLIFYSVGYMNEWTKIIGTKPDVITRQMYFAQNEGTSFSIIPQGFGMSYARLYEYAAIIKSRVNF